MRVKHLSFKLKLTIFCGYFDSPKPHVDTVQECVDRQRVSLSDALRHKGPTQAVSLEFRHEVFKDLFSGKGRHAEERNWQLYDENDFSRCNLPTNWSCIFDKHGDGVRIRFPVKMRRFLSLSPKTYERVAEVIVEAPRAYTEKISVKFVKVSSSCN